MQVLEVFENTVYRLYSTPLKVMYITGRRRLIRGLIAQNKVGNPTVSAVQHRITQNVRTNDCGLFLAGQGLVFDYFINPENGEVARWSDKASMDATGSVSQ